MDTGWLESIDHSDITADERKLDTSDLTNSYRSTA